MKVVQTIEAMAMVELSTSGTGAWMSLSLLSCMRQRIVASMPRTMWTIHAHHKVGVVAAKAKEDEVATTRWASKEEDGDDAHPHPATGEGHNNQFHVLQQMAMRALMIARQQTTIIVGGGERCRWGRAEPARGDRQQPAWDGVRPWGAPLLQ